MEEILVVSHCILNPASKVVSYNLEEINEETAKREKLLDYIIKHNIRMIQLPCPEFTMYGAARWGHVKEQFNHPFFRKQCRYNLIDKVDTCIIAYALIHYLPISMKNGLKGYDTIHNL